MGDAFGGPPREFEVEVTTVERRDLENEARDTVKRRHSLLTRGWWQSGMEDVMERDEWWANLAFERAKVKLDRGYGPDTAILVHVATAV